MSTVTRELAAVRQAIRDRFHMEALHDLGTFACRRIRGQHATSDAWSQHAWGNAWDVGADPDVLDDIESYLSRMRSRGTLPVGRVLRYDSHVHVEGDPERTGTPPCAGGPDDPDAIDEDDADELAGDGSFGERDPDWTLAYRNIGEFLADGGNWWRLGQGAAGVGLIAVGLVLVAGDTLLGPVTSVLRRTPAATAADAITGD